MKTYPVLIGIMVLVLSSAFIDYSWASSSPSFSIQWGTYGLQNTGQFAFPQGVSVDSSGNVYVTDLGNRRIEKFDNNGNFLFTFGTKGGGDGQFNAPVGIAITSDSIYVVDNAQNNIQKFDSTGKFVTKWGGQGSNHGQFLLPQGVAVDPSGDVYVVDTGNSRVEKFDGTGKFLLTIGQSGLGDGQFLSPRAIAADSQGSIYVADSGGNKIEKFTEDGVFLKSFDASTGANLQTPLGMSVDKSGNIFVADSGNNRIVELDSNGHAVTSWGSQGTGADFFDNPRATAVDSNGNVFVVDSNNNRIQKFVSVSLPTVTSTQTQTINQTQTTNPTQQVTVTQNTTQANTVKITDPTDHTPPSITAPSDMTLEATGILTPVSIGQATGTDDSGIASITSNAPQKFPLGITMITWTAIDNGGNVAKAVQKITVVDTTPPVLTAPQPVTVEAKTPDHNSVDIGLPSVNDAVGVESVTNDAPPYFSIGKTTVTWKAIDTSGNAATATQVVTVKDTTSPVIHAPSDITQEATNPSSNVVNLGNSTVTDNGIIKSVTNNAPAVFPIGKTTVTWTATDQSGNSQTATQVVNIVDTTAPKISPPPQVTFEATSLTQNTIPFGNATVTDNGIIKSVTNNATQFFPLGKTTILWVATDASGNKANATQVVDVIHTIPPKLTVPANVTFEATSLKDNTVPFGNATAADIQQVTISNNASKTFPLGKTTILWTAKDVSGNTSNATQVIDVVDTTAPKITAPTNITVEATSLNDNTVQLSNPSVVDLQSVTVTNNASKTFPLGKTTILWVATDASGNRANATQTVIVKDTTAPKITAPSDVNATATSLADNTVPFGNATVSDNVKVVSLTNNASKTFPLGKTTILWVATDESGNKANATQVVDVKNTTPPQLTVPAGITFEATSLDNNTIPIGNATANDIEHVTITNNSPKVFPLGKTTILWVATDASGNKANATQVVDVIHTIPPKLTVPTNVTFEATSLDNNTISLVKPTATDIEPVTITNNAPSVFPLGKTVVLWVATDQSGNKANATQTVTVKDTTAPKLTVPTNVTFEATSLKDNTVPFGNATAADIQQVTISNNASKTFPLGKTTILWTAKDASGNTSNATQVIDVVDTTAPKITAPHNIIVNATSSAGTLVNIGNSTASDNVKIVAITNDAPTLFQFGNTTVTWIATDESGNKANATQIVQVVDRSPPKLVIPKDVVTDATAFETPLVIGNANGTGIIDTSPKITSNSTGLFHIGKTVIQWTATDKFGNEKALDQTVTVLACGKPSSDYNLVMGTNGSETLTGSMVPNLIIGLDGNDVIHEGPSGDCVIAGDGSNIIYAGNGTNTIYAGNGDNIIKGGTGNMQVFVGTGHNMIQGGSGQNTCSLGNPSNDLVSNCQTKLR
ncbi:MAG: HYR domain-containing protein [Thaumarchaeota archaeon]|nr:HYR domain-containing protein [Nitrososphaerota archaeon]